MRNNSLVALTKSEICFSHKIFKIHINFPIIAAYIYHTQRTLPNKLITNSKNHKNTFKRRNLSPESEPHSNVILQLQIH